MRTLDAVVIESNHDSEMLTNGPYPKSLKQRIRGRHGHLSNVDSAALLCAAGSRLKWACLAHLSEDNNDPELAVDTHRRRLGHQLPLFVANRYEATDVLEI
jgi:phosphoribosyl 1,2-cyclic phosphodiesterase